MPLMKHQKERLTACEKSNCFHPAHAAVLMDGGTHWFCNCHCPISPSPCRETLETMERKNYMTSGDCTICSASHARNPINGLEGTVVFVCDRCYGTPLGELRRFYK